MSNGTNFIGLCLVKNREMGARIEGKKRTIISVWLLYLCGYAFAGETDHFPVEMAHIMISILIGQEASLIGYIGGQGRSCPYDREIFFGADADHPMEVPVDGFRGDKHFFGDLAAVVLHAAAGIGFDAVFYQMQIMILFFLSVIMEQEKVL